MTLDKPYFMTNEEWYYYDHKTSKYKLTDKATEEAKKSYKDFYKQLDSDEDIDEEAELEALIRMSMNLPKKEK